MWNAMRTSVSSKTPRYGIYAVIDVIFINDPTVDICLVKTSTQFHTKLSKTLVEFICYLHYVAYSFMFGEDNEAYCFTSIQYHDIKKSKPDDTEIT